MLMNPSMLWFAKDSWQSRALPRMTDASTLRYFSQERPDAFASLLGGVKPRRAQHEPQRTLHVVRRVVLGERLQFREASERAFGLLIELGAESGQLHAPAFAYEQLRTELPLEIGYGLRNGLHGHVLLFGSGRKAIVLSCRHEVFYLLDVHVTRSFEAHQRHEIVLRQCRFLRKRDVLQLSFNPYVYVTCHKAQPSFESRAEGGVWTQRPSARSRLAAAFFGRSRPCLRHQESASFSGAGARLLQLFHGRTQGRHVFGRGRVPLLPPAAYAGRPRRS